MKTTVIIGAILLLLTVDSYSQVTLLKSVESSFKTVKLDDGSFRYLKYNIDDNILNLYYLNDSLWKTVQLPLPKHHFLNEIKHVSTHIFNNDDSVEIGYSCVVYNISDGIERPDIDLPLVDFTLNIITESGQPILSVKDSNDMEIKSQDGHPLLFVYKHERTRMHDPKGVMIYTLREPNYSKNKD